MSLHTLANHMSAHGRGPDSTLVHMSPREVQGLQALAMRHGGSLTINPQTGLPEAGFLSSILPLVAGVGLTAMGMPAGMAALTVGGGTALVTGDLGKGLMAGLGAYGGAGLAESLIGSGAAGLAPEAAAASLNAVPTETAAQIASNAAPQAASAASGYTRISPSDMFATTSGPPSAYQSIDATKAAEAVQAAGPQTVTSMPDMSRYSNASNATADGPMAKYGPSVSESRYPVQPPSVENMTAGQRFDALKAGATGQNLLNYAKANPLQTAGMLAGPLMAASEGNNAPSTPVGDSDRGAMANAGYEFDPGWSDPMPSADPFGREQRYNRPRYYIPKKAADGGAVQHFDDGGAVGGANQGTPALNKFLELQAARAANPNPAPALIDAKQQFADYLKAQSRPVSTTPAPYRPPVVERLPTTTPGLSTAGISALAPQFAGPSGTRGGLSLEQQAERDDPNSWMNLSDEQKTEYYSNNPNMLGFSEGALNIWAATPFGRIQNYFDPSRQDTQRKILETARADAARYGKGELGTVSSGSLSSQIRGQDKANLRDPVGYFSADRTADAADAAMRADAQTGLLETNVGSGFIPADPTADAADAAMRADAQTQVLAPLQANQVAALSEAPAPAPAPAFSDYSNEGRSGGGGYGGGDGGGATNASHGGDSGGWGSRDAGGGARGGFLNHGRFDQRYAYGGGIAALNQGGMYNLGSYSDGGRLLRGPGDGVSDSIPAVIGQKQPARLADGEFVIPARIVSEIGNGSTQAGARKLYAMMDKVQRARRATVGKGKVAKNTRADKYLPA